MAEARDLHGSVVENLYDGVYYVDRDRRITYWNKGAERITGYAAAEVCGQRCMDNILVHVDDEGRLLCLDICPLQRSMDDGALREAHVFLRHKDGHRHPVAVRAAPIRDTNGAIIGAVEIFTDDSERALTQRRLEDLERAALLDPLTEVPNRRYLEICMRARLAERQEAGLGLGVIFVDIDHFKRVNDSHGHLAGDAVLKTVAATLRSNCRAGDVVGRWGGEEFVVLAACDDAGLLFAQAERLRALVEASAVHVNGCCLSVTISAGGALARTGDMAESLLARADALMYTSKNRGRNRVTTDPSTA